MRLFPLLLLLLTVLSTSAQNNSKTIKLTWQIRTQIAPDGTTNKILSFPGADYPDQENPLPYYYELRSETYPNATAELIHPIYIPLNEEEKTTVQGLQLPSSINISLNPVSSRKIMFHQISFIPLRKNQQTGAIEKLTQFEIQLHSNSSKAKLKASKTQSYVSESVLKTGKWIKIAVDTTAFYKISYTQLLDMGIETPANVRIYGFGGGMIPKMNSAIQPDDLPFNSVWFQKGSDGIFNQGDFLLFYAQGPQKWSYDIENNEFVHENHSYSDEAYYFLTSDQGGPFIPGIVNASTGTYNNTVTEFDDYRVVDQDFENLLKSGRLWLGTKFDITTKHDFAFNFPNLINNAPIKLTTHLVARSASNTSFVITETGKTIGKVDLDAVNVGSYSARYASEAFQSITNHTASGNPFTLSLEFQKSSASSKGWLDYLRINARRKLSMTRSQMAFRDTRSVGTGNQSKFIVENSNSSYLFFDVSNPQTIQQILPKSNATTSEFILPTTNLREFVGVNPAGDFPSPRTIGAIPNQNLHSLNTADLLIISPAKFMSYANQLADFHQNRDNLKVLVVDPVQIYNEFSSGARDVSAIRNFVKMFYDRAASDALMPRYLLLFGDGSYDNKLASESNTNLIPSYQSINSLSPVQSFVTDDFYGLLDNDEGEATGMVDIGIGRFPVNTQEEAQTVVQKIKDYTSSSNLGNWRAMLCFIGDDEDNNIHTRDANRLAVSVEENHPQFQVQRIFLDDYQQETTSAGETYPEVNRSITENINKGTLIMNYTGHGNEYGLAHEHVLTIDDILSWQNKAKMPLFMTATCEFSRFDNYRTTSAGELILLKNTGGGIALFTTTRLVFSSQNYILNQSFYNHVFEKNEEGKFHRLGDVMRLTKRNSGTSINKRNFTLLGDPALTLNYPKNRVKTLSVNNTSISQAIDTLKALSKITISGQLEDEYGKLLKQFQGIIYPTVYDKSKERSTRGNDGTPFTYSLQNKILFKGKASVKNGKFTFTFMVPKDIDYRFGPGKISYYANNSNTDAAGYNTTITVGGSLSDKNNDNTGPEIDLYMNDENFAHGGITDSNPLLLAIVRDSSGINTVGTAIGHNITARLDQQTDQEIQLNDHYESELDDYQKGKITYQFSSLREGEHNLQLKVWDNVNNSSLAELDFIVAESAELAIKHVLNYPNPFTTQTGFFFEHNHPNRELDVLIQILTVAGRIVKTIETTLTPDGFRVGPIPWDGRDDFGNRIGKGVYFYRLQVRDQEGKVVNKYQKLVLLK